MFLERRGGFVSDHLYTSAIRGFAARLTAGQIQLLERDALVDRVEPDGVMTIDAQTLPWGIDRVDADISSTLAGNGSGTNESVHLYTIDTGVQNDHPDLLASINRHQNFTGDRKNFDCNGHGTHVSGTAAALDNATHVVGVAPGLTIWGVKVLGCAGSGSTSGVIAGVDWVALNHMSAAVANMSLGGSPSTTLDNSVKGLAASGVFVSIAAGNSATTSCNSSPARLGAATAGAMTVMATDISNLEASFSNFGSCADGIHAPGVNILSTYRNNRTATLSGTSMSAPHVAGGAALVLKKFPAYTPAQVEAELKATSVATGTNSKDGAPIRLLSVATY